MVTRFRLRREVRLLGSLALGALLAGCATAYSRGEEAFHTGRYEEAAHEFEAAAASSAQPLDALAALGISRYKLGDLTRAQEILRRVLAEEPGRGAVRLYVALTELGQHEDARALEDLVALRPLIRHPRIAATVDRATAAIREGLSEPTRRLVVASLDDAVEWASEVREANRRPHVYFFERSWPLHRDRYHPFLP